MVSPPLLALISYECYYCIKGIFCQALHTFLISLVLPWQQQFRRALSESQNPAQTSSSSKSVSPPLRANETLTRFLISRSDLQCASYEDGCFAPETELETARLNCPRLAYRFWYLRRAQKSCLRSGHIRGPALRRQR